MLFRNTTTRRTICAITLATSFLAIGVGCWPGPTPIPTDAARLRKGPYLLYPGNDNTMTVLWQTDSTPSYSAILWGSTPSALNQQAVVTESDSSPDGHQFAYTISSLTPGTRTYYAVTVNGQTSTGSFRTAPESTATSVSIYAYGDTQGQPAVHNQVVGQMMADMNQLPDARQTVCLHAGDVSPLGMVESSWDQYFDPQYANAQTFFSTLPILACVGNHEIFNANLSSSAPDQMARLLQKYWPYPLMSEKPPFYYSLDYGPVHVAVLDQYTTSYAPGSPQLAWLEQDLSGTMKPWKMVLFHDPVWTAADQGPGTQNSQVNQRAALCPIFERNAVSVVVQGHHHFYARCQVNGIQYMTLGTAGAPLVTPDPTAPNVVAAAELYHFGRFDIANNTLAATVISSEGVQIDTFIITVNPSSVPAGEE